MKIDLHLHTKAIAKGDPESRNITPEDFKEKMKDAGIGIAAITNHYYFDKSQYEEMKDDDYILLPGVELDILLEDGRKVQANVITDPKKAEWLEKILKNEIKNNIKPLDYQDFLDKFNTEKNIISLDYKNGDMRWKPKDMEKAIADFEKAFVLADANNANTFMVLNTNDFDALIGTDIRNWDQYKKEAEKLINTPFKIDNYEIFWTFLKQKGKIKIKEIFENISFRKFKGIKMENSNPVGEDYSIESLSIKERVNVIFGEKRTGKSQILNYLRKATKNNHSFYVSSEKKDAIEELKKELFSENLFDNEKKEWKEIIKKILNFKEKKFIKFHEFFQWKKGEWKITFHNNFDTNRINPNDDPKIEEKIKSVKNLVSYLKKSDEEISKLNMKNEKWKEHLENILKKSWEIYKECHIKAWKRDFNIKIKNNIDKFLQKNKGITACPGKIGLVERFNEKNRFKNLMKKMNNFKSESEQKIQKFEIPKRKEVWAVQKLFTIDFENMKNIDLFKNRVTKIKGINKKLKKIKKIFDFDINILVKSFNELSSNPEDYIFEKMVIIDQNKSSWFSNGEESHMLLQQALSKDKEYYLLDEPAVFLSKESITEFLLPEINNLVRKKKKIVIATHNNSMGINTMPINYILRKYKGDNSECQTYTGSIWTKEFKNIKDDSDTLDFKDEIISSFEGSERHFNFRKVVYSEN